MIKYVRRRTLLLVLSVLLCTFSSARAIDRTIAKINDTILTESDLAEVIATANGLHHPTQIDAFSEATTETVASMLDRALLLQEARRLKISPPNQELHREVEDMVRDIQASFVSEADFHRALASERLSLNQLKTQLLEQTRDDFMVYHVVNSQFSISDAEVERLKAEGGLSRPASYRLYRLGVAITKKTPADAACRKARELVARSITEGISFEEAIRRYSEVPGAEEDGGDMGYVELDKLSATVRNAVQDLEVGQASAPLVAGDFANIFYVAGKRGERVALREQKFISTRNDLLKSLRRKATLQVYDDRLMPLLTPDYRSQVGNAPRLNPTPAPSPATQHVSQSPAASPASQNLLYAPYGTPASGSPASRQSTQPSYPSTQHQYQHSGYPPQQPQATPPVYHHQHPATHPHYPAQQTPARRSFWGNFRRNQQQP